MQSLQHTISIEQFRYMLKNISPEEKYPTVEMIQKGREMGLTSSEMMQIWDDISAEFISNKSRINKRRITSTLYISQKRDDNNPHKNCKDIKQRLRNKLEMKK